MNDLSSMPILNSCDRSTYLGSSAARDVISGKYAAVYRQMVKGERPDLDGVFAVQLGRITEDLHVDWTLKAFNDETGGDWKASKGPASGGQHFAHFTYGEGFSSPVLGSHPDYLIRDPSGQVYPVEVKLTGRFKTAEDAAEFYMPQLQHHMLCWDVDRILFSVVIGTSAPERIWVGASPEYQKHYLDKCDTLWGYVSNRMPPPSMTYTPNAKVPAAIRATVPLNGMKRRDVTGNNALSSLLPEFLVTKAQAARHEEVKKELKGLMAEDESALYCDGFLMERNTKGSILLKTIDPDIWTPSNEV